MRMIQFSDLLGCIEYNSTNLAANGIKNYTELVPQACGNDIAQAGGNADTFKSVAMVLTPKRRWSGKIKNRKLESVG